MHEDAHGLNRTGFLSIRPVEQSRVTRHGREILRIFCRNMERAQPAVRMARYVKLPRDLVSLHDEVEEFREDPIGAFEEQLSVGRCGRDDDVSALLRFLLPVGLNSACCDLQRLRAPCKYEHRRICTVRVVASRQYDFVSYLQPAERPGLLL